MTTSRPRTSTARTRRDEVARLLAEALLALATQDHRAGKGGSR